jgi:hypothetical protein
MKILKLVVLTALAGCASQEPVRESVQVAPKAAQPANAATPVALADATTEKFKVPSGYKSRTKDGATVYCKKETILGSRFPKEFCFSQAQLEELEAISAEQRRQLQKGQICGAASGLCAGG